MNPVLSKEAECQNSDKELEKLREENQILEEDLEDVFKQKIQAESQNKELEKIIDTLEDDNAMIHQENGRLKKLGLVKHVTDEPKFDELEEINADLTRENEELKEILTEDRTKLNQANQEVDKLQQDVKALLEKEGEKYDEYENEIKALEDDLEDQYKQRVILEKEKKDMELTWDLNTPYRMSGFCFSKFSGSKKCPFFIARSITRHLPRGQKKTIL